MSKTDPSNTVWINVARIVAAFAVVAIHCSSTQVLANDSGISAWLSGSIINSFSRWCVPIFVMISGALLLKPHREMSIMEFYKKRGMKLLIPCIFWILIYLGIRFIADYKAGRPHGPMIYMQAVLDGKVFFHTWYVFMLIGLYLVTPFLQKLLSVLNKKETLWFTVIAWFLTITNDWLMNNPESSFFMLWFLSYLGYFIMGYCLRYFVKIRKWPAIWLGGFLISSILIIYCRYLTNYEENNCSMLICSYTSPYVLVQSFFIICFFMSLEYRNQKFIRICEYCAPLTLGIYLAHPVVMYALNIAIGKSTINTWILIPSMTIIVYMMTLAMVFMLKKIPLLKNVV